MTAKGLTLSVKGMTLCIPSIEENYLKFHYNIKKNITIMYVDVIVWLYSYRTGSVTNV